MLSCEVMQIGICSSSSLHMPASAGLSMAVSSHCAGFVTSSSTSESSYAKTNVSWGVEGVSETVLAVDGHLQEYQVRAVQCLDAYLTLSPSRSAALPISSYAPSTALCMHSSSADALPALHTLAELADSSATPLDILLANRALATVVCVVQRPHLPSELRLAAWSTAVSYARRLASTAHCFRARVASADLRPLLDRALSVLDSCCTRGMLVSVAQPVVRKEVVAALQLLCCLGQGDVFFHALLVQQCKVPAALLRFAQSSKGSAADSMSDGVQADMQLAGRLQCVAARLRQQLLNAH